MDRGAQAQDAAGAVDGDVLERARNLADARARDSPSPTGQEMRDGFFVCPHDICPTASDNSNAARQIAYVMYFWGVLQNAVTAISNMNMPETANEWLEAYAHAYRYFWTSKCNYVQMTPLPHSMTTSHTVFSHRLCCVYVISEQIG